MRNILQLDRELGDAEFAFMDNHFHVLEMAYFRWKQKQSPRLSPPIGSENLRHI
jgi:hypothetical protein